MCERKLLLQVKKGFIMAIGDKLTVAEGTRLIKSVNLALGLDVSDSTVLEPRPAVVSMSGELVEEIRMALLEAIASEDGLDGNEGMRLIEGINLILGRSKNDFTVSATETREGVAKCL